MGIWAEEFDACEVYGSRRETFTRDSFEASVTVQVPYADKDKFISSIFGLGTVSSYPLSRQAQVSLPPYISVNAYLKSAFVAPFPVDDLSVAGDQEVLRPEGRRGRQEGR